MMSNDRPTTQAHLWTRLALALAASLVLACAPPDDISLPASQAEPPVTPTVSPVAAPSPTLLPAVAPSPTLPAVEAPWPVEVGAQVLFGREASIWALPLTGGQARRIASGLQFSLSAEQGDLWCPAPDGRFLALARNVEGQPALLSLLALDDGRTEEIGRFEGRIDALSWSHDGSRLAFLVNRREARSGELLEQSLRLYDTASQGESLPYHRTFGADEARRALWLRAWAPGNQALYVISALDRSTDPGQLQVVNAQGGEPQVVSDEYMLVGGQPICPATGQVLLRRRGDLAGGSIRPSPIYSAQAAPDGSLAAIRQLSPQDWLVGAVAWSPDGKQVAVERLEVQRHGSLAVHLWLLTTDGASPRQLTSAEGYREEQLAWAADGRSIIFDRWKTSPPVPAGLWILRLDEPEPRLLDEAGADAQVVVPRALP